MSTFSKFWPSRNERPSGQDFPVVVSTEEKMSQEQDTASLSSRGGKKDGVDVLEEADLVSPGQLTLEEG